MWQDVRYAARSIVRRPLVSAVAVLSLALGIGVNTAIFSVFDRLLLRQLPVPEPQAIVNVTSPGPRPGSTVTGDGGGRDATFSHPLFRDLRRVQTAFSGIAAHSDFAANLSYRGQTLSGEGALVSGGYFPTLAIVPALGRLLVPDDDRPGSANDVIVLSHSYWRTRFGASPTILDDTLIVNGVPMTIVGVAAEGFDGTTTMTRAEVFAPLATAERLRSPGTFDNRRDHWLYVFGRLKQGVTPARAQSLLAPPFSALIREAELPFHRAGLVDREREAFMARTIVLEDGSRGGNAQREETQTVLRLLFLVTGLVLLIACANVANLLLARATDRSTEVAVRLSIGGSAGRILRLLLTESCLLGLIGGAAALVVAGLTVESIVTMMPLDDQALLGFELNGAILLFAGGLGVATGLLFGLFPAVHAVRTSLSSRLSDQPGRSTGSRSTSRVRTSLATAQIALATALLAQAGLFIVSMVNVARVDLGIEREGLVTFRIGPRLNGYDRARSLALFEQLEDRLAGIPGVKSVSAATIPVLGGGGARNYVVVERFDAGADVDTRASYTRTGPDYFSTLGVPLLAGREFTRGDAGDSPAVAIVNEAFARKFGLGRDAVGKRMGLGRGSALDIEIVGLVADAKYNNVRQPETPQFFLPYRQADTGTLTFYVRSAADSPAMFAGVLDVVKRLDASLPVENLRTMSEQVENNMTTDRVLTTLSSAFAGLATLLAGIGLYAVLAYGVAQRVREFGIRMALGARTLDVGWLVLSHVGRITLIGGAIGGAIALGLGRLGQALLFGVEGFDGRVISGATAVVVGVALLAGLLPARRAARVDPATALRAE
jgi:predicted permease